MNFSHWTKRTAIFMTLTAMMFLLSASALLADAHNPSMEDGLSQGCGAMPSHDTLKAVLDNVVEAGGNGGFALDMWATIVNRDGEVCAVAFSGEHRGDQWPGSRVISAQKANTANAFSLPGLALSTANLHTAVQPGGSLYGLQHSNPVDTDVAYGGSSAFYGQANDPMTGRKIGGVNVFGGGLALYNESGSLLGAIGVSGDTSCTDHIIAWRVRDYLGLDFVPGGVSPTGDDNIIFDETDGFGHPACGLGEVEISETLPATLGGEAGDAEEDYAETDDVTEVDDTETGDMDAEADDSSDTDDAEMGASDDDADEMDADGVDTEADDTEADDTEADDTEADDTEADDHADDNSDTDDAEMDASDDDADEMDGEGADTEADDTEADDTEADDTEADDTEADDTEADDTEADDTEADNHADDNSDTDDAEMDASDDAEEMGADETDAGDADDTETASDDTGEAEDDATDSASMEDTTQPEASSGIFPPSPTGSRVAVANRGAQSVSLIDVDSEEVLQIILEDGSEPMYVQNPLGSDELWIGDRGRNRVLVYDALRLRRIAEIPTGQGVFHMWSHPALGQMWVVNDIDKTMSVMSLADRAGVATVPIPADLAETHKPHDITLTASHAIVSLIGGEDATNDWLVKISGETYQEVARLEVPIDPHLMHWGLEGSQLYVAAQAGKVFQIDPDSFEITAELDIPGAHGIWANEAETHLYVSNIESADGSSSIYTIDLATFEIIGYAPADAPLPNPHNLMVSINNDKLFITHSKDSESTAILDLDANGIPTTSRVVKTGTTPFGIMLIRDPQLAQE